MRRKPIKSLLHIEKIEMPDKRVPLFFILLQKSRNWEFD